MNTLAETLNPHAERLAGLHLRDLFRADHQRPQTFSRQACGLLVDFSKEKLDEAALSALMDLTHSTHLPERMADLFAGSVVNESEGRAALHMALRDGVNAGTQVGDVEVLPLVQAERTRMLDFAEAIRGAAYVTQDGQRFSDVVNIGIGGSDLGADMAVRALTPWHDGPRVHFVSNVDGAALTDVIRGLDPAQTLIIVASKSFSTLETMMNARSARVWLESALGDAAGNHMVALSSNKTAVSEFGISEDRTFSLWDWVGGRFSIWSSVGLPLAIAIGADPFHAFLDGARSMDTHFRDAPLSDNLPVLMGLIAIWRRNALNLPVTTVVPYEERLTRLPAYLQQLDMESNGKRVSASGQALPHQSGGVIFGEPGTNAQHSFFQLLHQGTDIVPVDFLVGMKPTASDRTHHDALFASALAQASALAFGRTEDEARVDLAAQGMSQQQIDQQASHRVFPGDRPSTMLMYDLLNPQTLGTLLALFEHRTFVQSVLWGINAFDQWGVERGKVLANDIRENLHSGDLSQFDASTAALIQRYRSKSDD